MIQGTHVCLWGKGRREKGEKVEEKGGKGGGEKGGKEEGQKEEEEVDDGLIV